MIHQFDTQKEDEFTLTKLAEIFEARALNSLHLASGVPTDEDAERLEKSAELYFNIAKEIREEIAARASARDRKWNEFKSRTALRHQ
jgi:hypothetical protein